MRPVAAQGAQVVSAEVEPGGGEQLLRPLVRDEVPLQVEEEQLGLDRGGELPRLLHPGAALRVGRVERVAEDRVGPGAAGEVVDRAELLHRLGELGRLQLRQAAAVAAGERLGAVARLAQHRLDRVGPAVVDQRLEVPARGFQLLVDGGAHRAEVTHGASL
jgi:hypothetical protein